MAETPNYHKGDLRRLLAVVSAIDSTQPATLVRVAERTGIDKKTVTYLIAKARVQAGIIISKVGSQYIIEDWGPVIKRAGAKLALTGELGDPP
jgi:hypothetical protein